MPCRPAISSQSLGRAWEHALYPKLKAASEAGFEGVEIFFEDLAYLANVYTQERLEDHGATETTEGKSSEPSEQDLLRAAEDVRGWCEQFKLEVLCLQPLQNFEGVKSSSAHTSSITNLKLWLRLCRKLNTQMILIPSSTLPTSELDETTIVEHLRSAADLAASQSPPINLAYEALAWGTLVNTWEISYQHVQEANRPNLGICIDTFSLAGKIYGDPTSPDGKTKDGEEALASSLANLKSNLDITKVFYIQLVDAEKLESPLDSSHPWYKADQPARMTWSRNARLFAYEEDQGGYLPVRKVMEVLLKDQTFEGWVSMELFSRDLVEKRDGVPRQHAERGMRSWRRLREEFGL
ncbi:Putative xylose isomerase-like, TIM barrel domain, xylose isomerase-like superfamily [Septoria linicola]|uniref:Xylose isomerase-like, TIM barrel domain, xylose isomerase-like superfamily n=1 Tax=Septoria linicola TaxID=215465 RepID=A0A9Q9AM71_9PEZI|nr:putative xylose isomerase-like, TIM barrel domain, xylose isomerase-like superfamily [Septoria linicola]USW51545.1 Putative xylose isomerase-like, TIM barrel domain, xylose isomerase-like superfamily [Septoria linicola]